MLPPLRHVNRRIASFEFSRSSIQIGAVDHQKKRWVNWGKRMAGNSEQSSRYLSDRLLCSVAGSFSYHSQIPSSALRKATEDECLVVQDSRRYDKRDSFIPMRSVKLYL